ncbi:Protein of unknown function [Gryllus bimaculatus]|nr:Protein of unknown function [Gryllus bimaculatus]
MYSAANSGQEPSNFYSTGQSYRGYQPYSLPTSAETARQPQQHQQHVHGVMEDAPTQHAHHPQHAQHQQVSQSQQEMAHHRLNRSYQVIYNYLACAEQQSATAFTEVLKKSVVSLYIGHLQQFGEDSQHKNFD